MTGGCDDCGHACCGSIWVGDTGHGDHVDEWDCEVLGRMTDDDVEMANEGKCPYWIPMEEESGDGLSEGEWM